MKNLLCVLFFFLSIFGFARAQNVVASNYGAYSSPSLAQESSNSSVKQSNSEIRDYILTISTKTDTYGINVGFANDDEFGYGVIAASISTGDLKNVFLNFGYGFDIRSTGEFFMFDANLYPYVGISNYDTINKDLEKVNKWKFNYGLAGGIKLGLNIYTSPSGTKHFITIGHTLGAPEFETHDMFKRGQWCLGLTIAY